MNITKAINASTVMKPVSHQRRNRINTMILIGMLAISILLCVMYLNVNVNRSQQKFIDYAMYIRQPKLWSMLIAAFCIGTASVAFQSVINNTLVTPCLLGMNSLYSLVNTSVYFFLGSASFWVTNKYASFGLNLVIMAFVGTVMYGFLFRKTKYNVLYVLLAGTVLGNLFGSITTTLTRVMNPSEYDVLLSKLIAGFTNMNTDLLWVATGVIILIVIAFWRYVRLLDVICLGKNQAINLGVDYDKSVARVLLGVVLLIAVATAVVGPLSFLGMILSNLARQTFKTYRHLYLMLGSFLIGVISLVGSQMMVEHVFGFNTSVSVFITISGGLYFLYLIMKNKGA